jgi:hypothetical protein
LTFAAVHDVSSDLDSWKKSGRVMLESSGSRRSLARSEVNAALDYLCTIGCAAGGVGAGGEIVRLTQTSPPWARFWWSNSA